MSNLKDISQSTKSTTTSSVEDKGATYKIEKHLCKFITFFAAIAFTALAITLSIASAGQRATTLHDRDLLSAVSVANVLAVHLLPALLQRRQRFVMWPTWVLCFLLAGYSHASWFYINAQTAANERQTADEVRQAESASARAMAQERAAIEQVLTTIKARPVATVAAQLSRTTVPERRESLALELAEAQRAAGLRDRLVAISRGTFGNTVSNTETAGNLEGTWSVTGVRDVITLTTSVTAALLVELLGALLWSAALHRDFGVKDGLQSGISSAATLDQKLGEHLATKGPQEVPMVGTFVVDEVADLRAAILRGECKGNVRDIRQYLGCRTETALRLKRALGEV